MSATDELCEMLGESWKTDDNVFWQSDSGIWMLAIPHKDDDGFKDGFEVFRQVGEGFTPEQAIAATLGRGTCRDRGDSERFICSECGCRLDLQDDDWEATMWLDGAAMVPNYCPSCGRRVEVVE